MNLIKIADIVVNLDNVTEVRLSTTYGSDGALPKVTVFYATGINSDDETDTSIFTANEARALWQWLTDFSATLVVDEAQS
jgi:hypothetical protein